MVQLVIFDTLHFTSCFVSVIPERLDAHSSHEELQREIDDLIYSLRRKKHDLYRQTGNDKKGYD